MTFSGLRTATTNVGLKNFVEVSALMLLIAGPVLLLSVRGAVSTCLVLLFLLSIVHLSLIARRVDLTGRDIAFALAMASLVGATLISQARHQTFGLDTLDSASRFLFVIPIYLMLKDAPLCAPRALEFAFPLGVFAAFITSVVFPWPHLDLPGTYFVDPANFGAATLILGFLSLGAINWTRKDSPAVIALKLAAFVTGVYYALKTGERGTWIAIPPLLFIWACCRFNLRRAVAVMAIALVAAIACYWFIPKVSERVAVTQAEIAHILDENLETPTGLRLQMWGGALHIITKNPIAGVGPTGAPDALRELHQRGWLTPVALEAGLAQLHNEVIAKTLTLGLFGMAAILAIYIVPMFLFAKTTRSSDRLTHSAGVMGLLFVTGYFIFGLTFEIFNIKMFATFYAVTVATLLATSHRRQAGQGT